MCVATCWFTQVVFLEEYVSKDFLIRSGVYNDNNVSGQGGHNILHTALTYNLDGNRANEKYDVVVLL